MINFLYNVPISRKEGYIPPPRLFDFQTQPALPTERKDYLSSVGNFDPQAPLWESMLAKVDDPISPVVKYGLSLEELNERVLTPFRYRRDVKLDDHTIPIAAMERIEIRAKGTDSTIPSYLNHFLDRISGFEWNGTDVTKEFIKDPPAWGPSIGMSERPELIPIDQLFDRLVTNDPLRQATRSRFISSNFADAVEAAFKCLNNTVKERFWSS